MSELKSYDLVDIQDYRGEVYLKSEADKVIAEKDKELRHHKYKRCLDKADWCKLQDDNFFKIHNIDHMKMGCGRAKRTFYRKWHKRWLELAEKLKETKQ